MFASGDADGGLSSLFILLYFSLQIARITARTSWILVYLSSILESLIELELSLSHLTKKKDFLDCQFFFAFLIEDQEYLSVGSCHRLDFPLLLFSSSSPYCTLRVDT